MKMEILTYDTFEYLHTLRVGLEGELRAEFCGPDALTVISARGSRKRGTVYFGIGTLWDIVCQKYDHIWIMGDDTVKWKVPLPQSHIEYTFNQQT